MLVIKNLTPSEIDESIREMAKRIDNSQIVMIPGGFSGGDEPDGSGKFIATAFRNPRVKDAVMRLLKERDGLMLGICNGFQALIKLGLVPYGEIRDLNEDSPTLTFNTIGRHVSCMVRTKITSTLSPWFNNVKVGDIHTIVTISLHFFEAFSLYKIQLRSILRIKSQCPVAIPYTLFIFSQYYQCIT